MPLNKNPRRKFKNTLNVLTNCFKGAGYKTLSRREDFGQIEAKNSKIVCGKDVYRY